MFKLLAAAFVALCLLSNTAMAQSCSGATWTVLANGNPADATQVMNNFNCVLSNPSFSGSVSIATTSPVTTFAVTGQSFLSRSSAGSPADVLTLNVTGPNYAQFYDVGQTGSAGGLAIGGASTVTGVPSSAIMFWNTNTGNVGIGTTNPVVALHVTGQSYINHSTGSAADVLTLNITGPNYAQFYDVYQTGSAGGLAIGGASTVTGVPSSAIMFWNANTGNVGIGTTTPAQALEVNGQVRVDTLASASSTSLCITATSNGVIATCSSSIRYKENVRDANFGLKEVMAMRPVTFKWKGRSERDFGLIAEEVARIDPQFVTYKSEKIEGVKYPQLTAVLVNAVKELKATNDKQADEISRLRLQNTAILKQLNEQTSVAQEMSGRLDALEHKLMVHTARK